MPSTSFRARSTKKAHKKKDSIVRAAMQSSALGRYQRTCAAGSGTPKAERPRARRIMLSKRSRAAVVAGEADSTDNEVVTDGMGGVTRVARNM